MADNRDEWILQTVEDCENYINEVGFLPLFASEEFPGGSVQERTKPWVWWTGNEKTDPWLWREQIAAKGTIAYDNLAAELIEKNGFIAYLLTFL